MTEDEKITFEERKAIVMIDGQMPESYANIIAMREIEEKRKKEKKFNVSYLSDYTLEDCLQCLQKKK